MMYTLTLNNDMELQLSKKNDKTIIEMVDSSDHEVILSGEVNEQELFAFLRQYLN